MSSRTRTGRFFVAAAALVGGLAVSAAALAEVKWTMSTGNQTGTTGHSGTDCGSSCASLMGNTRTFAGNSGSTSVTAGAWSNTGGINGGNTNPTPSQGTLETAYLGLYSGAGLGTKNRDGASSGGDTGEWASPEHSVDNQSRFDSVLFSFTNSVDLNKVEIGFVSGDSDITVLAYTGAGAPTTSGTYADLTNQGWTFIGHYTDLVSGSPVNVNAGNVSSAYWLIGGNIPAWGTTYSSGNDHVKLLALYGDKTQQVPEPNAALLLGLALAGIWVTRRKLAS